MVAFYSIFLLVRDGIPPAPGREEKSVGWVQRPGLALYSVKVVCPPLASRRCAENANKKVAKWGSDR